MEQGQDNSTFLKHLTRTRLTRKQDWQQVGPEVMSIISGV